jgi:uncharacterized damage-inducible protein DinB
MIQQTPWLQRMFRFDFHVGLFPIIFSRLEGSVFRLYNLLQAADEENSSKSTKSWSIKQHVGPLYDLEELWWKRLNDFQQNKKVLTAADMTNAKTDSADHNNKKISELLQLFTAERNKILETVYDFNEDMLNRTSLHPRLNIPFRLVGSLFFVAEHDDHHIADVTT